MSEISFENSYVLTIDGQKVISNETKEVINPATEEVFAHVPLATKQHLDDAVSAASRAFPVWSATPVEKRQELLSQLGELVKLHEAEFAEILIKDVGKPKNQAIFEVGVCVAWLKAAASHSLPDETIVDTPDRKVVTRYVPLGVCAAITPWNYPLSLVMWKVCPALVTGNCLIVKPTPFAPLAALKFGELAQQILPPGVLSFLSGNDELGPWISEHPGIAKVSLTGSVAAGKAVMRSVSSTLKRITLELGGNDPVIICEDVDPVAIAPELFWGSFGNTGQVCIAMKRIYIHEDVYDAVRDAFVAYAKKIKVGNPADPSILVGPLQNSNQHEKVKTFFEDCHQNGYKFALGGDVSRAGKGYFLPLSIVDNPPESSKIVQEEPFGPIVPLIKWSDEKDVIKRANDSELGLAASVWSKDLDRALRIAEQIQAGSVWINEHQVTHWNQSFGGFKQSGIGVEHGKHGLYSWVNIQTLTQNRSPKNKL